MRAASRTPGGVAALLVTAVLVTAAIGPATTTTVVVPAGAVDDPPSPPPVRVAAPDGDVPAATPGLRLPALCAPPGADAGEPPAAPPAERLQLDEVHRLATGAGQTVAVIDTGVAPHPRLGTRLRGGGDYLTGGDGLDDCDGHGTAVAGLIAASPAPPAPEGAVQGGRRDEVVGVAPGARIVAIRQSSPSVTVEYADGSTGGAGELRTLAEAIVLAVRAGAGVVNISEAVCLSPERAGADGALVQAALAHAADADVVVVAAAGNAGVGGCPGADEPMGGRVSLPGWYDGLLAVGAVDPFDAPAHFTVPGPWVDVAAPGTHLRSLAVGSGVTGEGTTGTSFAAPLVAGVAALVRERFPRLTAAQVADRILATARRPARGRDDLVGFGVVDPLAALTAEPAVLTALAVPPVLAPGDAATLLAGRTPAPPPDPAPPVEALALPALLGAATGAALALRRRPRHP